MFEETYDVRFVDMRNLNFAEVLVSSNSLVAKLRAKCIFFIIVSKMMIENQGLLPLHERLEKVAPATKNFGITHLHDPILYIFSEMEFFSWLRPHSHLLKTTINQPEFT